MTKNLQHMGSEEFNMELINYLYDEMSTEERIRFEAALKTNPELQKEFEQLKNVRQHLAQMEDKEVMEPFILWGKNGISSWKNPFVRRNGVIFKPFFAIAASLVILILVGYLTRFSITYNQQGLYIGFDQSQANSENPALSQDNIANLVKQEIAKNNMMILSRINETESNLKSQMALYEKQENSNNVFRQVQGPYITRDEMNQYINDVQNSNKKLLQDYLSSASVQQQEYFKSILTEFSSYIADQRSEDMSMIRRTFVTLKENQDQQRVETEQLLANILTNVNNQNN